MQVVVEVDNVIILIRQLQIEDMELLESKDVVMEV
jgi:hypothetical protein